MKKIAYAFILGVSLCTLYVLQGTVEAESHHSFSEQFHSVRKIAEAGSPRKSSSVDWWLSSGAYVFFDDGVGKTVSGRLFAADPWRVLFRVRNPIDTDYGYRPQNIFRLVTRDSWTNLSQEAFFRIKAVNLSESPNRNASNGLFFFNRYQDEQTVYYTGIRVDGYAVIKKKYRGTYTTLAYKRVMPGEKYERIAVPNLLPVNEWIGLKSEVSTRDDGSVTIKLYTDIEHTGTWTLAAEAVDRGAHEAAITLRGHAGIRTDFMDAEFRDYSVREL
jgi:hypothetical protein